MLKHEDGRLSASDVPASTVDNDHGVLVPSVAEAFALPATVDVPTAARFFGVGRPAAYRMCREGRLPFEVLRVGKRLRVTRSALLGALGISGPTSSPEPVGPPGGDLGQL